jgi:hypothetical protein
MIEWAQRAGKLVFQEAENLHEDNVVTFCNLALFWHSQGSWRISLLHKGTLSFDLSWRTCVPKLTKYQGMLVNWFKF